MKPNLSYTIWFSQRTGSSLLCRTLEATGVAGRPREWFNCQPDLRHAFQAASYSILQETLWELGSTENGIFGMKHSFWEPQFGQLLDELRKFPICPPEETNRAAIWGHVFPNHRHIFMTRRNKVRLAVSWWKAIQSKQWHRLPGEPTQTADLSDAYSYDAIQHLYDECSLREAGIQEFFTEGGIVPLSLFYEDFERQYEQTVRTVLEYLEIDERSVPIPAPSLAKTADEISEAWVQRFRRERQENWTNRGW